MKTKTGLFLLAGLVLALALAVRATRAVAAVDAKRSAVVSAGVALRGKIDQLEKRLQSAQEAIASLDRQEKERQTQSHAAAVTPSAGNQPTATGAAATWSLRPEAAVSNDAQKLAEHMKDYRASLDLTLGGLFKKLGLSREQREQLKDLKVWFQQNCLDLDAAALAQGLDLNGKAFRQLRQNLENERMQKEAALLGLEGREQYRNYYRLQWLRESVQRIASSEIYPEIPATWAAADQAVAILAANSQRDPKEYWDWRHWTTINWEAAGPQLQGVLSPAQLETLQFFFQEGVAHTAVAQRNVANIRTALRLSRQPGK